MKFLVENCITAAALLYWLASFFVLHLRVTHPQFHQLTIYGERCSSQPLQNRTTKSRKASWPYRLLIGLVNRTESSFLGRRFIARRWAFSLFYICGIAASVLLLSLGIGSVSQVAQEAPLILFLIHCFVRLGETVVVQQSRPNDFVSIFAVIAGCTFYAMAAVSSAPVVLKRKGKRRPAPLDAPSEDQVVRSRSLVLLSLEDTESRIWVAMALNLAVQVMQVTHHLILAMQRFSPKVEVSSDTAESDSKGRDIDEKLWELLRKYANVKESIKPNKKAPRSGGAPESAPLLPPLPPPRGAWRSYHYPSRRGFFRWVMEPHYTCEVLFYLINSCLMWELSGISVEQPLNTPSSVVYLLLHHPSLFWRCICSICVTVFTARNLNITAAEHQRFWIKVNQTRAVVRSAVRTAVFRAERGVLSPLRSAMEDLLSEIGTEFVPHYRFLVGVW